MQDYEYIGCFFDPSELFEKAAPVRVDPLPNEKRKTPHVTFVYGPETVETALFGQEITVTAVGYGNDGENEGLQVTLAGNSRQINELIAKIPAPHITLAVSDSGQAVNTRYLEFSPIAPFTVTGRFGGHLREEE